MQALLLIGAALLVMGSGKSSSSSPVPPPTPPAPQPDAGDVIVEVVTTTVSLIDRYTNWLKGK